MDRIDGLAGYAREVGPYRRALWGSQLCGLVLLLAAVAAPGRFSAPLVIVAALLAAVNIVLSRLLRRASLGQFGEYVGLLAESRRGREQSEELFTMTDMLQSADDHNDAGAVLKAACRRLLPNESGALYVFNNSRDRLDLATSWAPSGEFSPPATLAPGNCWALKRGKLHVNDPAAGTLCCQHHVGDYATLEVPMIARGTVYGLLLLASGSDDRATRVREVARIARALADTLSLALSNIALREKLRTQSLRDPLTGLYNRRYMEDALDRYLDMAERSQQCTSVLMIDLDNFKALNDQHGHAKGDAVLRDVAAQLVGALRPADVVSRYGGEELLVILPGCPLEDAVLKAETLRARIESLSEGHGAAISASFGVACVPETSNGSADVIPMADAALYEAKLAGRNCVRAAELRAPRGESGDSGPRLAAA